MAIAADHAFDGEIEGGLPGHLHLIAQFLAGATELVFNQRRGSFGVLLRIVRGDLGIHGDTPPGARHVGAEVRLGDALVAAGAGIAAQIAIAGGKRER